MEDLIMKIIDIEEKAQEIIEDAKAADNELEERIKNDGGELQSRITHKMELKNAALRQLEQDAADERIKEINKNTKKSLSELEETFNAKKEIWVDNIVKSIIEN